MRNDALHQDKVHPRCFSPPESVETRQQFKWITVDIAINTITLRINASYYIQNSKRRSAITRAEKRGQKREKAKKKATQTSLYKRRIGNHESHLNIPPLSIVQSCGLVGN